MCQRLTVWALAGWAVFLRRPWPCGRTFWEEERQPGETSSRTSVRTGYRVGFLETQREEKASDLMFSTSENQFDWDGTTHWWYPEMSCNVAADPWEQECPPVQPLSLFSPGLVPFPLTPPHIYDRQKLLARKDPNSPSSPPFQRLTRLNKGCSKGSRLLCLWEAFNFINNLN